MDEIDTPLNVKADHVNKVIENDWAGRLIMGPAPYVPIDRVHGGVQDFDLLRTLVTSPIVAISTTGTMRTVGNGAIQVYSTSGVPVVVDVVGVLVGSILISGFGDSRFGPAGDGFGSVVLPRRPKRVTAFEEDPHGVRDSLLLTIQDVTVVQAQRVVRRYV